MFNANIVETMVKHSVSKCILPICERYGSNHSNVYKCDAAIETVKCIKYAILIKFSEVSTLLLIIIMIREHH